MAQTFIPGIELCRRFYWEAVRPVLDAEFAGLHHSAALIGSGSEVLGFDTVVSTDHHWGPRAMLFLGENDFEANKAQLFETFRWRLPHRFLGYPTNFAQPVPEDPGTRLLLATESGPVDHRVEVFTVRGFLLDYLGFDLDGELTVADWLSFPQQKLRTLTGGEVYHDGIGLDGVRPRFAYYPRDVWLYMLASGVDAHRAGGAPDGPGRSDGRRARVSTDRSPAGARRDEPLLPDGARIRAVRKVVRDRFHEAGSEDRARGTAPAGVARRILAGARRGAGGRVRDPGGDAQPPWADRAAAVRAVARSGAARSRSFTATGLRRRSSSASRTPRCDGSRIAG